MNIDTIGSPGDGYAGDVRPDTAWRTLQANGAAQLVDVRTSAEWAYVGIPDLSTVGKEVVRVEWQQFPTMEVDPAFAAKVSAALSERGVPSDAPVFFICRSGARSARAAKALTAAGWSNAYNVTAGFEGDPDGQRHRGHVNGWKVDGLPWVQS